MLQSHTKSLVDANVAAVRLGIPRYQIYELVKQNIVPHVHLGRRVKFDPDKLEQWIEAGGRALPGGWKRERQE